MKKLLIVVLLFVIGVANVKAISESELLDRLTKSYTVNGATFQATDEQKVLIERYLDQYEVSSADADYIVAKLEEVFSVLRNSGKTSFYDLSSSEKQKIISLVADVAANTSIDCAIVNGNLVVYVPGSNRGKIFYESPVTPVKTGKITQTSGNLVLAGFGLFAVVGCALALRKIRNA
ncbi:MAG: hypothetical protein IKF19_04985 [Bacilli bacterium]|nr:hypothetical protein [Bacilli bacterium]